MNEDLQEIEVGEGFQDCEGLVDSEQKLCFENEEGLARTIGKLRTCLQEQTRNWCEHVIKNLVAIVQSTEMFQITFPAILERLAVLHHFETRDALEKEFNHLADYSMSVTRFYCPLQTSWPVVCTKGFQTTELIEHELVQLAQQWFSGVIAFQKGWVDKVVLVVNNFTSSMTQVLKRFKGSEKVKEAVQAGRTQELQRAFRDLQSEYSRIKAQTTKSLEALVWKMPDSPFSTKFLTLLKLYKGSNKDIREIERFLKTGASQPLFASLSNLQLSCDHMSSLKP